LHRVGPPKSARVTIGAITVGSNPSGPSAPPAMRKVAFAMTSNPTSAQCMSSGAYPSAGPPALIHTVAPPPVSLSCQCLMRNPLGQRTTLGGHERVVHKENVAVPVIRRTSAAAATVVREISGPLVPLTGSTDTVAPTDFMEGEMQVANLTGSRGRMKVHQEVLVATREMNSRNNVASEVVMPRTPPNSSRRTQPEVVIPRTPPHSARRTKPEVRILGTQSANIIPRLSMPAVGATLRPGQPGYVYCSARDLLAAPTLQRLEPVDGSPISELTSPRTQSPPPHLGAPWTTEPPSLEVSPRTCLAREVSPPPVLLTDVSHEKRVYVEASPPMLVKRRTMMESGRLPVSPMMLYRATMGAVPCRRGHIVTRGATQNMPRAVRATSADAVVPRRAADPLSSPLSEQPLRSTCLSPVLGTSPRMASSHRICRSGRATLNSPSPTLYSSRVLRSTSASSTAPSSTPQATMVRSVMTTDDVSVTQGESVILSSNAGSAIDHKRSSYASVVHLGSEDSPLRTEFREKAQPFFNFVQFLHDSGKYKTRTVPRETVETGKAEAPAEDFESIWD